MYSLGGDHGSDLTACQAATKDVLGRSYQASYTGGDLTSCFRCEKGTTRVGQNTVCERYDRRTEQIVLIVSLSVGGAFVLGWIIWYYFWGRKTTSAAKYVAPTGVEPTGVACGADANGKLPQLFL